MNVTWPFFAHLKLIKCRHVFHSLLTSVALSSLSSFHPRFPPPLMSVTHFYSSSSPSRLWIIQNNCSATLSSTGCLSSLGCYLHTQHALTTLKNVCSHTLRLAHTPHTLLFQGKWGSCRTAGPITFREQLMVISGTACGPTGVWGLPCLSPWLHLSFIPIKPANSLSTTPKGWMNCYSDSFCSCFPRAFSPPAWFCLSPHHPPFLPCSFMPYTYHITVLYIQTFLQIMQSLEEFGR